jgi:signal transduction histidine kinase
MKVNFVSSVSHELRAPIASMRLMAESLSRGAIQEPSRQSEYYRFIVQECRRLASMIENVLNFSRIDQGRMHYEFEPVDIRNLVEDTVKLMAPATAERQVRLQFELGDDPSPSNAPPPMVDGIALQRALINVIDNALKHSPEGGTVRCRTGFQPAHNDASAGLTNRAKSNITSNAGPGPGPHVWIAIEDQGPGIPIEDHRKIFERFYRRGSELRRETQGVGIGLSIVKHIVDAHNGRIRVESKPGHGATFILELPVHEP